MNRRNLISGFLGALSYPVISHAADDSNADDDGYVNYGFYDYFDINTLGAGPCLSDDIKTAEQIVANTPHVEPYQIMARLQALTVRSKESGELFNSRWKKYANPLIIFMFHEMHYYDGRYPDDMVEWCAGALSWCLYWGGYNPPRQDPCKSQSFLQDDGFIPVQEKDLIRGDICVFTRVDDDSRGHVGFWSPDQKDVPVGMIKVLGGNQPNQGRGKISPLASQVCFECIDRNEQKDPKCTLYLSGFVRPIDKMENPSESADMDDFNLPCGHPAS